MRSLLKSVLTSAAANLLSLGVCAWVFPHFSVTIGWLLLAVVVFTAATVALHRVAELTAPRFVRTYGVAGGLVLTAVALALTDWLVPSRGFSIDGWGTWIGVTILVWAAGVAYGEIDRHSPPDADGVSPRISTDPS